MTQPQTFWSRRKTAVAEETKAERLADIQAAEADLQARQDEMTDEELLVELNLPDPDTMEPGADFKAFMGKAVLDRLRRRALRRLWATDPVLANVDGLVDYGEDFTDSAMVVENMQTAYQIGRGMLKHVQEMARQDEQASEAASEATAETVQEAADEETQSDRAEGQVACDESTGSEIAEPSPTVAAEEEEELIIATTPRRMVFRFEAEST